MRLARRSVLPNARDPMLLAVTIFYLACAVVAAAASVGSLAVSVATWRREARRGQVG